MGSDRSGWEPPSDWGPPEHGGSGPDPAGGVPFWSPPPPSPYSTGDPADGPPPPPWERDRRRRRRRLLIGLSLGAVLLLGIPLVLAVIAALDELPQERETAGPDDPDADRTPLDDSPVDVEQLDGIDAVYGQLLNTIDESERAMIGFQDDLIVALRDHAGGDIDVLLDAIVDAAANGQTELTNVRARMAAPLQDSGVERVRVSYVEHLDSWLDYMAAIEADPTLVAPDADDSRYTVAINTTGYRFAAILREELPDDVDAEVERLAEALIQRGFPDEGAPDA